MEFQTLKKSYKKQIIIGALAVCVIGGALTFNLTRAKYKVTESIPLVKGNVNYSVPDLRVVAIKTSEDGINYTDVSEVPASGYTLNTTNSICKIATTDTKDENITIEYSDGKVNFLGVGNKNTRCYLYFDKYLPTGSETILANLGTSIKTTAPDFSQIADTDEGVYAVSDGMYGGTSYYWRGSVTNNYVSFANKCWRIVRINGDGSIRLIYDGATCHSNGISTTESIVGVGENVKYNTSSYQSNYVGWTYSGTSQRPSDNTSGTESNAKIQLESWYSSNITGTNATKVTDGKYCNDRNVGSGYTWAISPSSTFYYAGYDRSGAKVASSVTPTISCPSGDIYTLKVGSITMDEVVIAGGKWGTGNNSYYLYNGQNYWTMSPYSWYYNGSNNRYASVFFVYSDGQLGYSWVSDNRGLRPVINLKADTTFSSGNGTLDNPYVVS